MIADDVSEGETALTLWLQGFTCVFCRMLVKSAGAGHTTALRDFIGRRTNSKYGSTQRKYDDG